MHDYLTAIPLALIVILFVTHGGQFAALFGFGDEAAEFSLRWRDNPLPTWYLAIWVPLSSLNAVIYIEEFARCLRSARTAQIQSSRTPEYYGF